MFYLLLYKLIAVNKFNLSDWIYLLFWLRLIYILIPSPSAGRDNDFFRFGNYKLTIDTNAVATSTDFSVSFTMEMVFPI